jgi:pSer/pThr/pTyr-binding forkhead associated (FHA) protein
MPGQDLPDGYLGHTVLSEHVSRQHWEMTIDGSSAWICDLDSTDGTRISLDPEGFQRRIPKSPITPLQSGSTIFFGDRSATVSWR